MRFIASPSARILTGTILLAGATLTGCGSGHRRAAPPPPTSTTVAANTTTTTNPPGPYQWSRAASPALAIGGGASSTLAAVLAPSGSGVHRFTEWLVAGTRLAADGSTAAAVWASADASHWTATSLTGPQVDSQADAAARVQSTTVIVGSAGSGADQTAAVWVSPSAGAPFAEVPATDLPSGVGAMTAVTGSGLGWFASGQTGDRVTLWYSSNARHWTILKNADEVIADSTAPHVDTLLATDGAVFAGGWEQDGTHTDAALWSSSDGVNWHPVLSAASAFAGGGDRVITALAAEGTALAPTGYVAVGGVRAGSAWAPVSWLSPDGASWSQPSTAFAGASTASTAGAVVRDLSLVPTSTTTDEMFGVGGGAGEQRVWKSTDGMHWNQVALPAAAAASSDWRATLVASDGAGTVVADGVPGEPHLLVEQGAGWSEPTSDPAVFGPVRSSARPIGLDSSGTGMVVAVRVTQPAQVVGAAATSTEFLTSADASTWVLASAQPAGRGPFARAIITGVARGGARVVAVGYQGAGAKARAVDWTSPDAKSWSGPYRLDPAAVAGGDQAAGLCQAGTTWAAVGSATVPTITAAEARVSHQPVGYRTVARAWTSADGVHWRLATVGAGPHPETAAAIDGCLTSSTGLDAYGEATAAGTSAPAPAYWAASAPAQWVREGSSPIGSGPTPIENITGSSGPSAPGWLAVGGFEPYPLRAPAVLAQSTNGGSSWQPLPTTGPPWQGADPARLDAAVWLGEAPVVAGSVDGRLAIWVGTPSS